MTADFLLELLSEEIPARMQAGARNDLARMFADELDQAGLSSEAIDVFSTPRRLALIARGVPVETQARSEEIKGPRASAPPQALEGFLRKTGLKREQLEERDGVLFAVVETAGQPTRDLLGPMIERIVRAFPWTKSMRWGEASASTESLRWVRSLHGVVAMLGEEIVPVAIDGIASGATTVGHRFHHAGPITIGGAQDYCEKLKACHVIVDQDEREKLIRDGAAKAAKAAGLALVEDEGLVVENAGLTEWPVPLLGRFDPDYLDVPREVIVLTMRSNQKYFACTDKKGALAPAFVCIANIDAEDGGRSIVEGNRRVLAARLADARFFWEQDLKVPLESQAAKLSGIIFHEKLGTVADKVERVAKLARWLVEQRIVTPAQAGAQPSKGKLGSRLRENDEKEVAKLADQVARAARLAKADLFTGMVGELPELQGVICGYLARAQGEPDTVADAIRDHYRPVGQGDEVPTAPVTVAVALADKLDNIGTFFSAGIRPTGSKDPFALRRASLGALELIFENDLRLSTSDAMLELRQLRIAQLAHLPAFEFLGFDEGDEFLSREVEAEALYRATSLLTFFRDYTDSPAAGHVFGGDVWDDERLVTWVESPLPFMHGLQLFLADRLKVQQREAGVRHDLIDAVFALGGEDDLVRLLARVKALQAFVETKDGADLLTGYKRAANILKKEKWAEEERRTPDQVRGDDLEPEEAALMKALDKAEPKASAAIEKEDFTAAMAALASLRGPIDAFFEQVTVNDPDQAKRARRLNLLLRFRDAVHAVADFSKIDG
ncbi:MAG: glycine--tRNA ligase subunit beta [Sphingomicrobium sp.]